MNGNRGWTPVCPLDALTAGRGVAALVGDEPDRVQVAIFRFDGDRVYVVGNRDPFSGAHVIARGLVGSLADASVVASPMYKQRFDLRTGRCLDDPTVALPVYPVRVRDGQVEVGRPAPDPAIHQKGLRSDEPMDQ
jgi:nitrite reductase (NADH) small subunit